MRRIDISDLIVGGGGGLLGFYIGLSREATIAMVVVFSLAWYGIAHAYRRWREAKNA